MVSIEGKTKSVIIFTCLTNKGSKESKQTKMCFLSLFMRKGIAKGNLDIQILRFRLFSSLCPGPFFKWGAGKCSVSKSPNLPFLLAIIFNFLYFWNIRRRIRCYGITESYLICYIYLGNLLM